MFKKRKRTGLALHTSNVALTTARTFTSYARRHFYKKYREQFRFARSVFIFDAVLLVIALGLLILNVVFFTRPFFVPEPGLSMVLNADGFISAQPMPIEVVIKAGDGRVHEDVELTWHLPPWMEIIRSEPPLDRWNSIDLGKVTPTVDKRSRLFVNIRALPKSRAVLSFSLKEKVGDKTQVFTGSDERVVLGSALIIETISEARAVQSGGSLPIVVHNKSSLEAPAVILRLVDKKGASGVSLSEGDSVHIGDMAPDERRVLFVDVNEEETQDNSELVLQLEDKSLPVYRLNLNFKITDSVSISLVEPLRSVPGSEFTNIDYVTKERSGVWVYHPLQITLDDEAARIYDLAPPQGRVHIPLKIDERTKVSTWSAIPYSVSQDGLTFGRRYTGILSTAFPFGAAARYYTAAGDQVGVGPLPPRAGEATSYWIIWSVGPTDADLKDLDFGTVLGSGVSATGKFASQIPGTFFTSDSNVSWTVPSLPATGDTAATFAFEIEYKPTASDRGKVHNLISESTVSAIEARSSSALKSNFSSLDTNLEFDLQAQGFGIVK
ncbi:MAG: hypothetical protein ABII13_03410 [Patescibacteria group bacterium]|nr:hypothetical protein [Patescibacteria group bacterium]MBU2509607.1 hypothetical protein [Patescibacteria group bacterium]